MHSHSYDLHIYGQVDTHVYTHAPLFTKEWQKQTNNWQKEALEIINTNKWKRLSVRARMCLHYQCGSGDNGITTQRRGPPSLLLRKPSSTCV